MPTRHILLTVAGMTPATVTEAVWALSVKAGVKLAEVRVLTTEDAWGRLEKLLSEAFEDMRRDFPGALRGAQLSQAVFPARDIRTADDNERLADWILAEVVALCGDSNTIVHASIAGGRKTMSFYLGAAMQLAGRPQDHLYHVLVDSCFEVNGFLYPAPKGSRREMVDMRDGSRVSCQDAKVDLADLPFVPLRGMLPDLPASVSQKGAFARLTALARDAVTPNWAHVRVHWGRRFPQTPGIHLEVEGKKVMPLSFKKHDGLGYFVYSLLLARRFAGLGPMNLIPRGEDFGHLLDYLEMWLDRLLQFCAFEDESSTAISLSQHRLAWEEEKVPDARDHYVSDAWYTYIVGSVRQISDKYNKASPNHLEINLENYKIKSDKRRLSVVIAPQAIEFVPPLGKQDLKLIRSHQ